MEWNRNMLVTMSFSEHVGHLHLRLGAVGGARTKNDEPHRMSAGKDDAKFARGTIPDPTRGRGRSSRNRSTEVQTTCTYVHCLLPDSVSDHSHIHMM